MSEIIDNYNFDTAEKQAAARQFFTRVYAFMFFALLVSGLVAYRYGNIEFITKYFVNIKADGTPSLSMLYYVVLFAPIGVALLMQSMANRLSFSMLFGLFALYSILLGLSLSFIFIVYSMQSIAIVFAVSAGTFGVMAVMGYVTQVDLTKFGSILMMGFWGIFIASMVNVFVGWESLNFIISIVGVVVFTGLTAYHMQQLKRFAHDTSLDESSKNKMALLGGFTLYILFVNLFLSLLQLFGSRD
jgi:hypothetical protein